MCARAKSVRQVSLWLRGIVEANMVWARLTAAERRGTVVIAGGADEDGHARPRGRVVLVVDDHADTREMYAQFLSTVGFSTCEASTCAEALVRCRRGDIAAVVLDRRLPDGDGMDVCRTLKAERGTRHLPIVVLSGWQPDGATGADSYLMKPVVPEVLVRELERLLASGDGHPAPER